MLNCKKYAKVRISGAKISNTPYIRRIYGYTVYLRNTGLPTLILVYGAPCWRARVVTWSKLQCDMVWWREGHTWFDVGEAHIEERFSTLLSVS